jgi:hypothetical protein
MPLTAEQREKRNAYQREWRSRRRAAGLPHDPRTEEGRERRRRQIREWHRKRRAIRPGPQYARAPLHVRRAGSRVNYAVRKGWLVRPDTCENCDGPGPIEAAHEDYNKPLDVRWLCRGCHRRWDAAEPKSKNWEEKP